MKIVTIMSQKGGVGKTTTAVHLSHALALQGKKVLGVDLDAQGQFGAHLGIDAQAHGVDWIFSKHQDVASLVVEARKNLYMLSAGAELGQLESAYQPNQLLAHCLQDALQEQVTQYDYVVIDCPTCCGLLAVNALQMTDSILIPVCGDYMSLHGMSFLLATLKNFEQALARTLDYRVIVSRFQPRRRLANEVLAQLKHHFPEKILATKISERAVLAECPSVGKTIFEYRRSCPSVAEYRSLVDDFLMQRVIT